MTFFNRPAARQALRRRRQMILGIDTLEERKVLSTMTGGSCNGTFEGMAWVYNYNQSAKTGTLTVTDKPGTDTIHITGQSYAGQEGDSGYDPRLVGKIVGVNFVHNDDEGGPSIVPGTYVKIQVNRLAGDESFVNDEKSFAFTYGVRSTTPPPPVDQHGTSDGYAWTYHYDVPSNSWAMNFTDKLGVTTLTLSTSNGKILIDGVTGPSYQPRATGAINVTRGLSDHPIVNNTGFALNTIARHSVTNGTLGISAGTISYSFDFNELTNSGVLTITAVRGSDVIDLNLTHLDLNPGDPGYDPHNNPVTGIELAHRGGEELTGVSFYRSGLPTPSISIVVKQRAGDVSFANHTGFSMSYQSR